MKPSLLQDLVCARCDSVHNAFELQGTCSSCAGPLLARYRLEDGGPDLPTVLARPAGQLRCHETYPTAAGAGTPTLGEGATPLIPATRTGREIGLDRLLVKDESQNPTLSFKARGMAAAVARAAELGVRTVCLPSAGNAGGAAAAYGALHGVAVVVTIPENTPAAIERECEALGADIRRVPGNIADAGRALAQIQQPDWFSLATLREPYRVEGKKVMGYELLYDLGSLPDVVVYPTGGGTGLIGMWKAFDEMEALGWIDHRRPRMVAVQVEGCAPIVRAHLAGATTAAPWTDPAETAAFGLRVPGALGDFLILRAILESHGSAIAVAEEDMMQHTRLLTRTLGLQAAPEGGACLAALRQLRERGDVERSERVVLFNTGHDAKYA